MDRRAAAPSLHAVVQLRLALHRLCAGHRRGVPALLFRSLRAGNAEAAALLGFCLEFGLTGLAPSHRVAERLYALAGLRGSGFAQTRLAFLKTHGRPDIKISLLEADRWRAACGERNAGAVAWLEQAANAGLAAAQYCLALCYYNGLATGHDSALAFEWCRRAAMQGLPAAQNVLGNLFIEGAGCEPDAAEGLAWYVRAAEQREAAAIYNIGTLFERGIAVEADFRQAFEWYMRAATYGSVNAQNVLGIFFEQGIGVDPHLGQAAQYYTKAALSGHAHAQYNLARCYHEGLGLPRNDFLALAWFERSALQKHVLSQLSTAIAYELGVGTAKSLAKAERFYHMAAAHGSAKAHRRLVPIVAQRMLVHAMVLLPARPAGASDGQAAGFCSLPAELRRMVLLHLDKHGVLSRQQKELIFKAAVEDAEALARVQAHTYAHAHTQAQAQAQAQAHPHSKERLAAASRGAQSQSQARAAACVVERLRQEVADCIETACSCLSGRCQQIRHVIKALEGMVLAG
nr:hypothetical protein HK105_007809 [Polyrhizophydium stewartii]